MKMALIYDPLNDIDLFAWCLPFDHDIYEMAISFKRAVKIKVRGVRGKRKRGKTQRAHPTLNPTQHQTAPVRTATPQDPDNQTSQNK